MKTPSKNSRARRRDAWKLPRAVGSSSRIQWLWRALDCQTRNSFVTFLYREEEDRERETRSALAERLRRFELEEVFPRDEDALLIVRRSLGDTWEEPDHLAAVAWLRDGGEPPRAIRALAARSSELARKLEFVSRPVNLDDSADPTTIDVQAVSARPVRGLIDPAQALEAALAARERGEDDLPILRFAVEAIRRAKELGLAGFALAMLATGTASVQASTRVAQANQPFFSPTRRRRGAHHGPAPRGLVTGFASVRVTTPSVVLKRSTGT